jgi:hypothetical protein
MPDKYFVWVSGSRGPEAQLWNDEPVDGNGKPVKSVLFKHKLTEQEELFSLSELTLKFNKDKPVAQPENL